MCQGQVPLPGLQGRGGPPPPHAPPSSDQIGSKAGDAQYRAAVGTIAKGFSNYKRVRATAKERTSRTDFLSVLHQVATGDYVGCLGPVGEDRKGELLVSQSSPVSPGRTQLYCTPMLTPDRVWHRGGVAVGECRDEGRLPPQGGERQ